MPSCSDARVTHIPAPAPAQHGAPASGRPGHHHRTPPWPGQEPPVEQMCETERSIPSPTQQGESCFKEGAAQQPQSLSLPSTCLRNAVHSRPKVTWTGGEQREGGARLNGSTFLQLKVPKGSGSVAHSSFLILSQSPHYSHYPQRVPPLLISWVTF